MKIHWMRFQLQNESVKKAMLIKTIIYYFWLMLHVNDFFIFLLIFFASKKRHIANCRFKVTILMLWKLWGFFEGFYFSSRLTFYHYETFGQCRIVTSPHINQDSCTCKINVRSMSKNAKYHMLLALYAKLPFMTQFLTLIICEIRKVSLYLLS